MIRDFQRNFGIAFYTVFPQFDFKSVFIYFFDKTMPKFFMDGKCRGNNFL